MESVQVYDNDSFLVVKLGNQSFKVTYSGKVVIPDIAKTINANIPEELKHQSQEVTIEEALGMIGDNKELRDVLYNIGTKVSTYKVVSKLATPASIADETIIESVPDEAVVKENEKLRAEREELDDKIEFLESVVDSGRDRIIELESEVEDLEGQNAGKNFRIMQLLNNIAVVQGQLNVMTVNRDDLKAAVDDLNDILINSTAKSNADITAIKNNNYYINKADNSHVTPNCFIKTRGRHPRYVNKQRKDYLRALLTNVGNVIYDARVAARDYEKGVTLDRLKRVIEPAVDNSNQINLNVTTNNKEKDIYGKVNTALQRETNAINRIKGAVESAVNNNARIPILHVGNVNEQNIYRAVNASLDANDTVELVIDGVCELLDALANAANFPNTNNYRTYYDSINNNNQVDGNVVNALTNPAIKPRIMAIFDKVWPLIIKGEKQQVTRTCITVRKWMEKFRDDKTFRPDANQFRLQEYKNAIPTFIPIFDRLQAQAQNQAQIALLQGQIDDYKLILNDIMVISENWDEKSDPGTQEIDIRTNKRIREYDDPNKTIQLKSLTKNTTKNKVEEFLDDLETNLRLTIKNDKNILIDAFDKFQRDHNYRIPLPQNEGPLKQFYVKINRIFTIMQQNANEINNLQQQIQAHDAQLQQKDDEIDQMQLQMQRYDFELPNRHQQLQREYDDLQRAFTDFMHIIRAKPSRPELETIKRTGEIHINIQGDVIKLASYEQVEGANQNLRQQARQNKKNKRRQDFLNRQQGQVVAPPPVHPVQPINPVQNNPANRFFNNNDSDEEDPFMVAFNNADNLHRQQEEEEQNEQNGPAAINPIAPPGGWFMGGANYKYPESKRKLDELLTIYERTISNNGNPRAEIAEVNQTIADLLEDATRGMAENAINDEMLKPDSNIDRRILNDLLSLSETRKKLLEDPISDYAGPYRLTDIDNQILNSVKAVYNDRQLFLRQANEREEVIRAIINAFISMDNQQITNINADNHMTDDTANIVGMVKNFIGTVPNSLWNARIIENLTNQIKNDLAGDREGYDVNVPIDDARDILSHYRNLLEMRRIINKGILNLNDPVVANRDQTDDLTEAILQRFGMYNNAYLDWNEEHEHLNNAIEALERIGQYVGVNSDRYGDIRRNIDDLDHYEGDIISIAAKGERALRSGQEALKQLQDLNKFLFGTKDIEVLTNQRNKLKKDIPIDLEAVASGIYNKHIIRRLAQMLNFLSIGFMHAANGNYNDGVFPQVGNIVAQKEAQEGVSNLSNILYTAVTGPVNNGNYLPYDEAPGLWMPDVSDFGDDPTFIRALARAQEKPVIDLDDDLSDFAEGEPEVMVGGAGGVQVNEYNIFIKRLTNIVFDYLLLMHMLKNPKEANLDDVKVVRDHILTETKTLIPNSLKKEFKENFLLSSYQELFSGAYSIINKMEGKQKEVFESILHATIPEVFKEAYMQFYPMSNEIISKASNKESFNKMLKDFFKSLDSPIKIKNNAINFKIYNNNFLSIPAKTIINVIKIFVMLILIGVIVYIINIYIKNDVIRKIPEKTIKFIKRI